PLLKRERRRGVVHVEEIFGLLERAAEGDEASDAPERFAKQLLLRRLLHERVEPEQGVERDRGAEAVAEDEDAVVRRPVAVDGGRRRANDRLGDEIEDPITHGVVLDVLVARRIDLNVREEVDEERLGDGTAADESYRR